jgi:hypothetical protein
MAWWVGWFNYRKGKNMKTYKIKLEESVVYEVSIVAHSSKEAEVEALRHPEKWQEQAGTIHIVDIKQGE